MSIFVVRFILFVSNNLIAFILIRFVNVLVFHSSGILIVLRIACILIVSSFSLSLILCFIGIYAPFITMMLFLMISSLIKLIHLIIIAINVYFYLMIAEVIYSS